jgi:hypothetical protein
LSTFSAAAIPFWKIEEWVKDYVIRWWPEYEAEFRRQWNTDKLPDPKHWETSSEFVQWQENSLPHIVIVCPGLADGEPYHHADGQVDVTVLITFVHLAGANDRGSSRKAAESYAAITRQMMEQATFPDAPSLGEVRYVDEDNTTVPPNTSIGSASVTFELDVRAIMNSYGGPPDDDPRSDPEPPTPGSAIINKAIIQTEEVKEIP